MAFDIDTLSSIYSSTRGFCHLCHRKLAFSRFGCEDGRGAWDIDAVSPHPKVTALLPGCLRCLQKTPPRPTPMSAPVPAGLDEPAVGGAEPQADDERAGEGAVQLTDGALVGGAAGALLGGLWGAILGGLIAVGLQLWG
jgi:hypothetical protein